MADPAVIQPVRYAREGAAPGDAFAALANSFLQGYLAKKAAMEQTKQTQLSGAFPTLIAHNMVKPGATVGQPGVKYGGQDWTLTAPPDEAAQLKIWNDLALLQKRRLEIENYGLPSLSSMTNAYGLSGPLNASPEQLAQGAWAMREQFRNSLRPSQAASAIPTVQIPDVQMPSELPTQLPITKATELFKTGLTTQAQQQPLAPTDAVALNWLIQNQKDPRAEQVKKRLLAKYPNLKL